MGKIEIGGMGKVRALSLAWGLPVHVAEVEDEDEEDVEMVEGKGKGKGMSLFVSLNQEVHSLIEDCEVAATSSASTHSTPRESYLLAGLSNSTIRRFDAPLSLTSTTPYRPTLRMTLDRLKGEHTVVWAIASLGDGTVVSGDSMGNVKFWDGEMGTQLYSFRGHKADVLCLGVGSVRSLVCRIQIELELIRGRWMYRMGHRFSLQESIKRQLNTDKFPSLLQEVTMLDGFNPLDDDYTLTTYEQSLFHHLTNPLSLPPRNHPSYQS